jgi:hypothetical protein
MNEMIYFSFMICTVFPALQYTFFTVGISGPPCSHVAYSLRAAAKTVNHETLTPQSKIRIVGLLDITHFRI